MKSARELPHAQWRIFTMTKAITDCLAETEIQTWRTTDESHIWQPQREENKCDAGCQQFVDEIMDKRL
jgi:hypothetical protein